MHMPDDGIRWYAVGVEKQLMVRAKATRRHTQMADIAPST